MSPWLNKLTHRHNHTNHHTSHTRKATQLSIPKPPAILPTVLSKTKRPTTFAFPPQTSTLPSSLKRIVTIAYAQCQTTIPTNNRSTQALAPRQPRTFNSSLRSTVLPRVALAHRSPAAHMGMETNKQDLPVHLVRRASRALGMVRRVFRVDLVSREG